MADARDIHRLERSQQDFLAENPRLREALELFRIGTEQYQTAVESLRSPAVRTSNSANEQ